MCCYLMGKKKKKKTPNNKIEETKKREVCVQKNRTKTLFFFFNYFPALAHESLCCGLFVLVFDVGLLQNYEIVKETKNKVYRSRR